MSSEVVVAELPLCDMCVHQRGAGMADQAMYDAATRMGPWAYVCQYHFEHYCYGVGTGRGQRLVLRSKEAG